MMTTFGMCVDDNIYIQYSYVRVHQATCGKMTNNPRRRRRRYNISYIHIVLSFIVVATDIAIVKT